MRRPRARASTCLSIGHGKEYDPGGLYDSGATLYLAFFPLSSSHVLSLCLCLCLFSRAHEREGRGKAYTNACMRVHASARARAKLVWMEVGKPYWNNPNIQTRIGRHSTKSHNYHSSLQGEKVCSIMASTYNQCQHCSYEKRSSYLPGRFLSYLLEPSIRKR